jgi:CHASE2 domain-containing sensor protein
MVTALDGSRTSYRYLVVWGLIASLLVAGLYLYPPFLLVHLDQRVYDVLFRSAQRPQTSGQVVIVDLDERSLARFGPGRGRGANSRGCWKRSKPSALRASGST